MAGTVLNSRAYSFDDAAFPIATSFYVGIGFQHLINARLSGIDKVFLALFIVWATDIGAYLIGRQFGRRKLLPTVSPNKTIEGSLGGIACAVLVSFIFMMIDRSVYAPHHFLTMLVLVALFPFLPNLVIWLKVLSNVTLVSKIQVSLSRDMVVF